MKHKVVSYLPARYIGETELNLHLVSLLALDKRIVVNVTLWPLYIRQEASVPIEVVAVIPRVSLDVFGNYCALPLPTLFRLIVVKFLRKILAHQG
jgi:hypothetical protein